jgi:hypothetical protein
MHSPQPRQKLCEGNTAAVTAADAASSAEWPRCSSPCASTGCVSRTIVAEPGCLKAILPDNVCK